MSALPQRADGTRWTVNEGTVAEVSELSDLGSCGDSSTWLHCLENGIGDLVARKPPPRIMVISDTS